MKKVDNALVRMLDDAEDALARGDHELAAATLSTVEAVKKKMKMKAGEEATEGEAPEPEPRASDMAAAMRRALGDSAADLLDNHAASLAEACVNAMKETLLAGVGLGDDENPSKFAAMLKKEIGNLGLDAVRGIHGEWSQGLCKSCGDIVSSLLDPEEVEEEEEAMEAEGDVEGEGEGEGDEPAAEGNEEADADGDDEECEDEGEEEEGDKASASISASTETMVADDFTPSGHDYNED